MGSKRLWLLVAVVSLNAFIFFNLLYRPTIIRTSIPLKETISRVGHAPRENATFVTLCRNEDLGYITASISSYEDRFNQKYGYDWVFLNDEEFTDEFKSVVSSLVSGDAKFGKIPQKHWGMPEWIDKSRALNSMRVMEEEGIIYGGSESYRHMCRFESGFFFQHELMQPYKYYWRVEPDTKIFCDINFDVFRYMRENQFRYGFTLALYEYLETIPTLWESTIKWLQAYPEYVQNNNLGRFITEDQGLTYNGCHFWTNLEIADADFWREEAYSNYFNYLDMLGGFYYERWGDAPVHSIAASLLLKREEIVHLDFIGYNHPPFQHIPANFMERNLRCAINPADNFDWEPYSCLRHFYTAKDMVDNIPANVEKVLY